MREAKGCEFERFVQTPSTTVVEYNVKFSKLSQYVRHLNLIEDVKIK